MTTFLDDYSKFPYITPRIGTIYTGNQPKPKAKQNAFKKNAPLIGSIVGAGVATAVAIAQTPKSKNFITKILKTDFADVKNMLTIALGSIAGGFCGGMIRDNNKDKWKKLKEANFQLLSNVAFPLLCLSLFKKAGSKLTKESSQIVKNIGNFISVFSGVGVGAFIGSRVANGVNNLVHPEEKYSRKLGVKDFMVHVDDLPVALAFAGIPYIDKLIPFILVSRGYDVGKQ